MEKKLLIFDVDGTVWDSEKDVFLSFNHTLKEHAGFEITKEEFQKLAGMPLGTMFETVLPEEEKHLSGFYMAVASSKPKRILDKMMSHFDLKGFQYVLGTEESNFKHKPDPEIVNYIIEQLKVSKADSVIIGDSKSDILTGKNAGIDTIAVTYGYDKPENLEKVEPTYTIDNFGKLSEIIKLKEER